MKNKRYVLSLGSNTEDRERRVRDALKWLQTTFTVTGFSEVYPTEPVGKAHSPYHNAVASIESSLTEEELDKVLKRYETSQGRDREARDAGKVPVDLDIVLKDDEVLRPWEFSQQFFIKGYKQL